MTKTMLAVMMPEKDMLGSGQTFLMLLDLDYHDINNVGC